MAVRTIACLPAVTGAWRDVGGGVLLSTSGTFPVRGEALERPDLTPPGTRTLNMSQLGRALTDPTLAPPVKALFVYNSNPAAVAPEQEQVVKGLGREDLFTVVHELFPTDTVDYADVVLPATTTLEHYDLHKAYGHLYLSLSRPAIAPEGESKPNTEVFRLLAARMGLEDPCLFESDEALARQALDWSHPHLAGITFERLEREGSVRLSVSDPHAPFAHGGFPTPSGKCELLAPSLAAQGKDPLAGYVPPREGPTSNPGLAARYPLAFISPPAHHFLNSTFSAQPVFVRREGEPFLTLHPEDAACPEHRRRGHGARLQRSRVLRGQGSGLRRGPQGSRGGPVGLVAQDVPGRQERQRRHRAGAHRHGRRRHLLRRPRGSRLAVIEELVAFHLAAAVLTLWQLARTRERRLVPLALFFLFAALGHQLGEWDDVGRWCLYGAGACGLWLLFLLTPRTRVSA